MNRTALRLTGFAVLLAALFTGGWAAGARFPLDDDPVPHQMDHGGDDGEDVNGGGDDHDDHDAGSGAAARTGETP